MDGSLRVPANAVILLGCTVAVSPLNVLSLVVSSAPAAHCRDGTYSFSTHLRGTCSHYGGVDTWL